MTEESDQVPLGVLEVEPKADLYKCPLRGTGFPESYDNVTFYFIIFLDVLILIKT